MGRLPSHGIYNCLYQTGRTQKPQRKSPIKILFSLIRSGKDRMPAEGEDRVKDDQVRSLIEYIRSFSEPDTSALSSSH